jgi:putative membrane protein
MKDEVQIRQDAEQSTDPRVDLAVQRTELAEDRTVLAWLRTAIGLMGAGVAFDKGTQLLHEQRLAAGNALVDTSHLAGLSLTAISTLLLILVLWQYRSRLRELARIKGVTVPAFSPTVVASVLVILLGIGVFVVLMISN